MKLDRVRRLLLAAALPSLGTPPVLAQPWPSKPVRMIVPTAADSAPDVIARLVAERLSALWGQAVIVENKHGAGGIHGMSTLAHSPNDGYTIGFVPAAMATITPLVYKNPLFNPDTQLQHSSKSAAANAHSRSTAITIEPATALLRTNAAPEVSCTNVLESSSCAAAARAGSSRAPSMASTSQGEKAYLGS